MCGIAGILADAPRDDVPRLVERMTQLLHHRGPDDGGAVAFGAGGRPAVTCRLAAPGEPVAWGAARAAVAIGARRLAILDRSDAGHQPMSAPDGHVWLVFNGEIYNYVELREELRGRGLSFQGASDTEVALAAYRAWGTACFARFRGMWAIAIVDWVAGRAVLSRDRLGIKPLYLAEWAGGHAFASEIKSLLALPGVGRDAHEGRLRDFLVSGRLDHTNATLFESVWQLGPGCRLEIDLRPATMTSPLGRIHRDWPNGAADICDWSPPAVRERLDDAIRLHLRSDVPVGSCLSGGLDSAAIVTSVHRMTPPAVWSRHAFTAVLPGDALDESRYADAVVAACPGVIAHRVAPEPHRLVADIDRIIWHHDEPIASPSVFMQWEVMRLARETGVVVLLDGQGGDELWGGYPGYLPPYLAELIRNGRLVRAAHEWLAKDGRRHFTRTSLLTRAVAHALPLGLRKALRHQRDARIHPHLAPELLDAGETALPPHRLRVPRGQRESPDRARGVFARFCWEQLLFDSLPSLLHYEDRNSMAFSIEARVPLLDAPLVELAMLAPATAKVSGGVLRPLWRAALTDRVPADVLARRDKIGFTAPTSAWMRGPLRSWWQDLLASHSFRERGCFEPKGVARLVQRVETGDEFAALTLWRTAVVEAWARRMLDQPPAA